MALTGITISSSGTNPTEAQLSQFLADGVLDVTSRWLATHPEDRELFMDETVLKVAQGANIDGAEIISVVRADGVTSGDFRPCRKISPAQQTQVLDTESLSFASKYHPVYMLNTDNKVNVFPAPSDNSGKDSYKIYYVNNAPKDGDGNALTYADSTLRSFPADKVYLVSLYAAVQSLKAKMANNIISITAVPPNTLTVPSINNSAIATTDVTASVSSTFVTYISTVFGTTDPGTLSVTAVPPEAPTIPNFTVSFGGNISTPTYTAPGVTGATDLLDMADGTINSDSDQIDYDTWWDTVAEYIENNQDVELAGVQLQKISTYFQAYGQEMQNQLNKFNTEMERYKTELDVELREAQYEQQAEHSAELQQYQADIGIYQAEVNAQVQEHNADLNRYTQELSAAASAYQGEIVQVALQNAQHAQQTAVKDGDLDLQAQIQDYTLELQKYQADLTEYQAEVTAQAQEQSTAMQQYQLLYTQLKQQYDETFMISTPPAQAQGRR